MEHFGKIDIFELPKQNTELKPIYLKNANCSLKIPKIWGPYIWEPSKTYDITLFDITFYLATFQNIWHYSLTLANRSDKGLQKSMLENPHSSNFYSMTHVAYVYPILFGFEAETLFGAIANVVKGRCILVTNNLWKRFWRPERGLEDLSRTNTSLKLYTYISYLNNP